jgi:hypothetical protein
MRTAPLPAPERTSTGGSLTPSTLFLSRLLGCYCLAIGLVMAVRGREFVAAATMVVDNPPLLFVLGVFTLLLGLALVLSHNRWSGEPPTVVVTLSCWAALVKGALLLILPSGAVAGLCLAVFHYDWVFAADAAAALSLGGYLAYCGFRAD